MTDIYTDIDVLRWSAKNILPLEQANWLTKGANILRDDFLQIGELVPDIKIVVGYPDPRDHFTGPGWLGLHQMLTPPNKPWHVIHINPTVNGLWALDILVHEMVHSVVCREGHGMRFQQVAAAIGLDDTGVTAGAEEVLLKRLRDIHEILGSYPLVFDCVEDLI